MRNPIFQMDQSNISISCWAITSAFMLCYALNDYAPDAQQSQEATIQLQPLGGFSPTSYIDEPAIAVAGGSRTVTVEHNHVTTGGEHFLRAGAPVASRTAIAATLFRVGDRTRI